MIKKSALLSINCFPSIAWFMVFAKYENVFLEKQENYQKQSFRNRYLVLTSQGSKELTIPVKKSKKKVLMSEILIDYSQNWQKNHWRTIQTAYGKSPYFEFLSDDFKCVFDTNCHSLAEFNLRMLTLCLKILRIKKDFNFTESYQKQPDAGIEDFREVLSEPSANLYAEKFVFQNYTQVFGSEFVENLSILDLIFNEGKEGLEVIEKSKLGF